VWRRQTGNDGEGRVQRCRVDQLPVLADDVIVVGAAQEAIDEDWSGGGAEHVRKIDRVNDLPNCRLRPQSETGPINCCHNTRHTRLG